MFTTDQSRALYERAQGSLTSGVSTAFRKRVTPIPLYFEHASGPYLYDVDGHELLDYVLAWGPTILGNNHPELNAAIREQLEKGYGFGAQHQGEIDLAERMVEVLPGVEQVIFSNTGSEAVQAALRLSRGLTGRDKIIKFEGHYHGWMNNVLVSIQPDEAELGQTTPTCGGQPAPEYADTITLGWNDLAAVEQAFADHPGQIAAVLTEPILVNAGSCMPDAGFLEGLIEMCRKQGAVSIFDEVITGFRLALGGAREYLGLEPDLSTYAKAMAGGYPMSAVGGSKRVMDALDEGKTTHVGTYNGNPMATAAALTTINVLSRPGTYERMHGHGYAIRKAVEEAAAAAGHPVVTCGTGSAFSVHFGLENPPRAWADVLKADGEKYEKFRAAMLEHLVYLPPAGRWYVGASHTDRELARVIPAVQACIKQL